MADDTASLLHGYALGFTVARVADWIKAQTSLRDALHASDCPPDMLARFTAAGDQVVEVVKEIAEWGQSEIANW